MRYWAYFAAKVVATCATFYGLYAVLNWSWPPEPRFSKFPNYIPPRFGYSLGYTFAALILFLLLEAALFFVWRD
jgi:hypothetical protein